MSYQLTDKAKTLLLEVAERIEAEPRRLNMHNWGDSCGTVGCIAGHCAFIRQEQGEITLKYDLQMGDTFVFLKGEDRAYRIRDWAAGEIGIDMGNGDDEDFYHPLFYVQDWVQPFEKEYQALYNYKYPEENQEAIATLTAKRIRHFVETGE